MKTKSISVVSLLAVSGLFSGQSLAHDWSIPHTHMGFASVVTLGLIVLAASVVTFFIKRRS